MTAHNSNLIEIHEFSTGIEIKTTQAGWESGGFLGEYMNRTINSIPPAISDSIRNREFALAEGSSTDDPAIVGREVSGYGEIWSVVAVVTRGRDDRGRGVSLYRYFMCRGEGQIETILRWMHSQKSIPVFNPFDTQVIGQPHQYRANTNLKPVSLDKFQDLLRQSPPILIPASETCMPLLLNQITKEKATPGRCAWAYKVAALEKPQLFQAIYPSDPKSEQILIKALVSRTNQNRPISVPGDGAIKTAIKACVNGRVKPEHISTLENALNDPQIDDKFWKDLLDKQGVSQALNGNVYGDRSVRLLTLKALITPRFLPDFLGWLYNSKNSEQYYQASLQFQEQIFQVFKTTSKITKDSPQLSNRIRHGVCVVIACLVNKPKIIKEAVLLLQPSQGLWSRLYRKSLYMNFENDLNLMRDLIYQKRDLPFQATQYPEWHELLNELSQFWRSPARQDEQYKMLAALFENIETPKLAAIFYQISEGYVPKSVFSEVSERHWQDTLFEMTIYEEIGFLDYLDRFLSTPINIGGFQMPKGVALFLFLIVFGLGAFSGWLVQGWGISENTGSSPVTKSPDPSPSNAREGHTPPPPKDILNKAKSDSNIEKTQKAIDEICENEEESSYICKRHIYEILEINDKLARAVYRYQKNESLKDVDGIIHPNSLENKESTQYSLKQKQNLMENKTEDRMNERIHQEENINPDS